MERLLRALRGSWWGQILAEHDTEPTELAGGLLKVVIGGWLLLPLQPFEASATFTQLDVLPEWAWGLALLAVGCGHLWAVWDGYVPWRRAASMLGFCVWFTLAVLAGWFNLAGLGLPLFALLAAGQGWAYVRLRGAVA